jgi:hypothetical protein
MAVSANYPTPVYVNGYQCNNCAQVAEAKKDINPADPKAGPGGIDASSASQSPAFTLGGSLSKSGATAGQGTPSTSPSVTPRPTGAGGVLDIAV